MNQSNESPLAQSVRQQMKTLDDAGDEAYQNEQYLRATELYGRALQLALSIGDTTAMVKFRMWQGESLNQAGKLREALAVSTPTLQHRTAAGTADDFYGTLICYIEIAIRLPVRLQAINKAFRQTEEFLYDGGHTDWRHMLLRSQSQLYQKRGLLREALAAAQEAWATRVDNYPTYTSDTYLNDLVNCSLDSREKELARRYLSEWERDADNSIPKERERQSYCRQSDLARSEGRSRDAVDWARRALPVAEQCDSQSVVFDALFTLIRAFLSDGEIERSSAPLLRLATNRRSEDGHECYRFHLLRGDYHLARARQAAGMSAVDDEFGLNFPPPRSVADIDRTSRNLVRSRRAYAIAQRLGQEIDEKLECHHRQHQLTERLARVEDIARCL